MWAHFIYLFMIGTVIYYLIQKLLLDSLAAGVVGFLGKLKPINRKGDELK